MVGVVAGVATDPFLALRFSSASRRASSKLCVELERDVTTFVCNEGPPVTFSIFHKSEERR
jgi:hypothetical protein